MLQVDFVFLLISFLPLVPIILYILILLTGNWFIRMKLIFRKSKVILGKNVQESQNPSITIVVPSHNEEKVIKAKILSILKLDYSSNMDVVIVDDSSDDTPQIIEDIQTQYDNIKLIHLDERVGYNEAIILGVKNAKGEFVVLTDSHSFLGKNSLQAAISIFKSNNNVGSISGPCKLLNPELASSKIEMIYQNLFNFLRKSETNISSTFMVKGEFIVLRKKLITDLIKINGCIDNESSLWIIKKGYKVAFSEDVYYFEHFPTKISERFKQKKVRAINLLRTIWRFKSLFFNPRYGFVGFGLYPFYFYFSFIFPLLIIFSTFSFTISIIFIMIRIEAVFLYIIIPSLIIITLIIPPLRHLILSLLQIEFSLLYAIFMIVFRISKEITQIPIIESTRVSRYDD